MLNCKSMKKSFLLGSIFLLAGCTPYKNENVVFSLENDYKEKAKEIKGELIRYDDELIYANRFLVYDSLLIVQNNNKSQQPLIEIRSLKNGMLLRSFFNKGEGPYELLMTQVYLSENILTIKDLMKKKVCFMNLDSIVINTNYIPKLYNYNKNFHVLNQLNDSCMVMLSAYKYTNKELGIDIDLPRLEMAKFGDTNITWSPSDFKYTPYNVTNGYIATSLKHKRTLYASAGSPFLELYNDKLHLLKTIRIPDSFEDKLNIIKKDDGYIVYKRFLPKSFACCGTINDCFYLLYSGYAYDVTTFNPANNKDEKYFPLIFKFDMEGNLLNIYKTDRYIFELSMSRDEKAAYATGFDENGEYALYKYNLEE